MEGKLPASDFLLLAPPSSASSFLDNSHHVSAIFLRFVHCFVHPVENRFLVWIGITDFRNAAAHGKADFLLVVNEPGVLDQFAESFGNRARALQVGTGEDYDEFISTPAGDKIRFAKNGLDAFNNLLEASISSPVTVLVVYRLEIVDVKQEEQKN